MAVICALLGFIPERRWLRHADKELAARFPRTIGLSGSNKQARKTFFLFSHMIGCWPWTPLYGATTSGSWIPSRCSAAVPGRRSSAVTRQGAQSTVIAPPAGRLSGLREGCRKAPWTTGRRSELSGLCAGPAKNRRRRALRRLRIQMARIPPTRTCSAPPAAASSLWRGQGR